MKSLQATGRNRCSALPNDSGRTRTRRRAHLALEQLERRELLTGNLWITGAQLVDSGDHSVSTLAIGEEVFVEAQWMTSGLSPSDQYVVRFTVDGVPLDSQTISGQ